MTRAWVVADLGFGDSGKGTIVDYLVRTHDAKLVVRWNGGAQAGHAVVTDDGRAHVFSQIGAGAFVPGVRTHLSEAFVLHPTALLVEAKRAPFADALSRLTIAESARVITPFHQAANRLRELVRGAARHGTCGVGVGETVRDSLQSAEAVRARDLVGDRAELRRKTEAARRRLIASLPPVETAGAAEELALMHDPEVTTRWIDALSELPPNAIVPDDAARGMLEVPVVLEGAQGVLLDETHGFHPHTTWSDCTPAAACAWLRRYGVNDGIERLGVLRTYLTRHGEGPFPSEDATLSERLPEAHNANDGWQGTFRRGHQDMVLLRYALRVSGGVDSLVMTHLDRLEVTSSIVTRYENDVDLRDTESVRRARPVVESVPPSAFVDRIETELGVRVGLVSSGPTASAKRTR